MLTLVSFIVAILILVSLHELGHLLVARLCGIKVLRFSVGFGKPFFTKRWRNIEWCFAPIPLGGYVKMVDTREGNVAEADLPYAFDKQHPAKKIAVVAAGPLTNLALAVLLYGLSFSFGISELKPFVGTVEPYSIAAKAGFAAGDKITAVNGVPVANWGDAQTGIVLDLEAGKVDVAVTTEQGRNIVRTIDAAGTQEAADVAKRGGYIGLMPYKLTKTVSVVVPGSAAEKAGLKAGDTLLAADGKALGDWQEWVDLVRRSAGQKLQLTYLRDGKTLQTFIRPDSEMQGGVLSGRVGLGAATDKVWDKAVRFRYYPSVAEAFGMAWRKTTGYVTLTLKFFGRLLGGQASLQHVSGPLTIADVAGKSASMGWQPYVEFLALVSVSLGVMNLLPVPVLDGGHLVFYSIEWLRGKPLSESIQTAGLRVGLALMMMLMILAFFNDITRLFG
ncbi:RIP metalloprotease RseP [Neisseria sp. oral taxon 020 str. F0370]|uniref:RIP metalloprotease RseP n=1 Tax=Neisseria sp. oral taxon 020 TaxID=712401 RepID=UPI0002A3793A|nr:RIP metalloprotease RseP [Neisseria sp. oral taxon 020]EKY06988.1 RIP metalloprotease RseP [Neisseria sp. oral taxon 020 str. F0370]